jgi:hypothetical protein
MSVKSNSSIPPESVYGESIDHTLLLRFKRFFLFTDSIGVNEKFEPTLLAEKAQGNSNPAVQVVGGNISGNCSTTDEIASDYMPGCFEGRLCIHDLTVLPVFINTSFLYFRTRKDYGSCLSFR